jgi:hypothetical protein
VVEHVLTNRERGSDRVSGLQVDPETTRASAQNEHEVRRARFVERLDKAPTCG